MKEWAIDLHMHSPLSPCGEDSMLPVPAVERFLDFGMDVIAVLGLIPGYIPFDGIE